jgi:hypothetical protein
MLSGMIRRVFLSGRGLPASPFGLGLALTHRFGSVAVGR